jgi:hypothetical protein
MMVLCWTAAIAHERGPLFERDDISVDMHEEREVRSSYDLDTTVTTHALGSQSRFVKQEI